MSIYMAKLDIHLQNIAFCMTRLIHFYNFVFLKQMVNNKRSW